MKKISILIIFLFLLLTVLSCNKEKIIKVYHQEMNRNNSQDESFIQLIPWPKIKVKIRFGQNKIIDGDRYECIDKGICEITLEFPASVLFSQICEGELEYIDGVLRCIIEKSSIPISEMDNFSNERVTVSEGIDLGTEIITALNLPDGYQIYAGEYPIVYEDSSTIILEF